MTTRSLFLFDGRPILLTDIEEKAGEYTRGYVINGAFYLQYSVKDFTVRGFADRNFRDQRSETKVGEMRRIDVPERITGNYDDVIRRVLAGEGQRT